MREGIEEVLKRGRLDVTCVGSGTEAFEITRHQPFDLIISDYKMSPIDGLEVLRHVRDHSPETDVILITAFGTVEVAVEAMKLGAADFITKPFSPDELHVRVEKIIRMSDERRQMRLKSEENEYLRLEIEDRYNFGEIVGQSPRMREIFELVRKSAESDSSVVIYGESGTGKELVARAIHYHSARRDKPFIKVNCAALTETLLESELFGHERGAFTGAIRTKKGRFELADTGTLFLDEIGDISLNMQVKLLRAIQEQEFERVGGETTLSVDTRIIAATNRNLQESMKRGTFREDLYYRLNVIPVFVPPLRERKEDIPRLVDYFVKRMERDFGKPGIHITDGVYPLLVDYDWPGNVRELENVIERAVVLSNDNRLTETDFSMLSPSPPATLPIRLEEIERKGLTEALESIEKALIEQALAKAGGGRSDAARMLGLKPSALHYKLEKYRLV